MTEQQASEEQTSTEEQSQTDSQQGTGQQQATEQTSELKDVKDLPGWAQKQIRDARKEAEKYRNAAKEREDAEKSELQKLTEERDDFKGRYESLEAKYRETRAESAFIDAASKANARSPRTLFRAYRDTIEYDDDGKPTNITDVVAALQADEPDLFRPPNGDGGKGGSSPAGGKSMNDVLRQMAKDGR